MADEVARTLPRESRRTLDNVVPITEVFPPGSPPSPSGRRKSHVGAKSAGGSRGNDVNSLTLESPKGSKSTKHLHEFHSEGHARKKTQPHRTLSAGSAAVNLMVEADSGTSESPVSLDIIQEEGSSQQKKPKSARVKLPRLLPLENIETKRKVMTQTRPESARAPYQSKSSRRRKSMGPAEPGSEGITAKFRKEARRGHTVADPHSNPMLSLGSSSEGKTSCVSVDRSHEGRDKSIGTLREDSDTERQLPGRRDRDKSKDRTKSGDRAKSPKDRNKSKDRTNVRRAKSDSTLGAIRVNSKKSEGHSKLRFEDLKGHNVLMTLSESEMPTVEKKEEEKEDLVYRMENGRMVLVWAKYNSIMDLIMNTDFNLGTFVGDFC